MPGRCNREPESDRRPVGFRVFAMFGSGRILNDRDSGIRALDLNDFHARLTSIDCSRFRISAKNEYLIPCGAITALYPRLRSTCRLSQGPSPRLQIPNSNSRRFRRIQWHQWLDLTVQPIAIRATVGLPKPFQELAYGF
jgi:hypothetical protein